MKNNNEPERISRLCTALSRITASLDLKLVLRESLASACRLTHGVGKESRQRLVHR